MPIVSFKKQDRYKSFSVEVGANLMQSLLAHNVPVASSCLGKGICSKCRVEIISNPHHLSSESALEKELKNKNNISATARISCQTQVLNDVEVDTSYW